MQMLLPRILAAAVLCLVAYAVLKEIGPLLWIVAVMLVCGAIYAVLQLMGKL